MATSRRAMAFLSSAALGTSVVVMLALGGCAAVHNAHFAARPDSTDPGDLLGPYTGRVIDAATRKPIASAHVAVLWHYEEAGKMRAGQSFVTKTNADGRYYLPRLNAPPAWPTTVTRATVLAYQPGYIAYRSDKYFPDLRERHDFAQEGITIALDRLTSDVSRVEHLKFLDKEAALFGNLLEKERIEANQELTGEVERRRDGPLLDASVMLTLEELRTITGYSGTIALERLGDIEQSGTYDSRHFRADGRPESFDVAYRVWKLRTEDEAVSRYEQLLKKTPNAEERDEVADRSLRGHEGVILAAGALNKEDHVVVLLTCGQSQCRDISQVVAILRRLLERVDRLVPKPVDKPAGE